MVSAPPLPPQRRAYSGKYLRIKLPLGSKLDPLCEEGPLWGGRRGGKIFMGFHAGTDQGEKARLEYNNGVRQEKHGKRAVP
jgi:hypothetical protein